MTGFDQLFADAYASARLWRIWMFLGLQDIKTRFRRSFIGPLWILLNLGIFVGSAGLVYGVMFGQDLAEFLPYLITGLVIWGYILSSFTDASTTFINAEGYIKQFSFPKEIYIMRSLVSATIVLLIGFAAIFAMQIVLGQFNPLSWLMAIPGLILLVVTTLGHITVSAYLGTRFRDWPHAMAGLLQVLFFVTPIMFPSKLLAERNLEFVYLFNPFYYLIDNVRHPILGEGFAPLSHYAVGMAYAGLVWVIAMLVARQLHSRVVFLL